MAGTSTSLEDAVRIIANKYTREVSCPPTDLDAIARTLNIHDMASEEMPISGELRRNGKGFRLVYSSYLSPGRKRFTIAHEIGHAIVLQSGPKCPTRGRELERICDMFAVELLMPESTFLHQAQAEPSAQAVKELATKFQTSLAAAGIRYANLKAVTVFLVEDDRVVWGSGFIKAGAVRNLDYSLREAISGTLMKSGSSNVFYSHPLWTGEWRLSWECLGKQKLFVFYPA
jgi:hypothetical protein